MPGDLDSAMQAVGAVSRKEQMHLPAGTVMPDPVASYGTETQRSHWLQTGLSTDRIQECDTFSAAADGKL